MRKKNTNISRYISIVVGLAVVLVVCYVLVYLCFKDNSGIPAGDDWKSVIGFPSLEHTYLLPERLSSA